MIDLVLVPGLGDEVKLTYLATWGWRFCGFKVHIYPAPWNNTKQNLRSKLDSFAKYLKKFAAPPVVIGASAGGSFVLNALYEHPNQIAKAVCLCGRLQTGVGVKPTLESASKKSLAFKQSVLLFERRTPQVTPDLKKKILVVRALNDFIVPPQTAYLKGAKNITTPLPFHVPSIYGALLIFNREILNFLK